MIAANIQRICIPLKPGKLVSDVNVEFQKQGWTIRKRFTKTETAPAECVWTTTKKETTIHLIEDQYIRRLYLVIRGPNADQIAATIERMDIAHTTSTIIDDLADESIDEESYVENIVSLALGTPQPPNETVVGQLLKALSHAQPSVRIRTLESLSYTDCPEFRDLARTSAREDESDQVRATANALLKAYDKFDEP